LLLRQVPFLLLVAALLVVAALLIALLAFGPSGSGSGRGLFLAGLGFLQGLVIRQLLLRQTAGRLVRFGSAQHPERWRRTRVLATAP
jgi:hypothetical protein